MINIFDEKQLSDKTYYTIASLVFVLGIAVITLYNRL